MSKPTPPPAPPSSQPATAARADGSPSALESLLHRSRQLEDAPDAVLQRAIALGAPGLQGAAGAAPAPGWVARWRAALVFDSAAGNAPALQLRSSRAAPRQLLFSAEGRDIDLRVSPPAGAPADGWQVHGQVLGPDLSGEALLRGPSYTLRTPWNELSEFAFDGVPPGPCQLTLFSAAWEIELPPFDIPLPTAAP